MLLLVDTAAGREYTRPLLSTGFGRDAKAFVTAPFQVAAATGDDVHVLLATGVRCEASPVPPGDDPKQLPESLEFTLGVAFLQAGLWLGSIGGLANIGLR